MNYDMSQKKLLENIAKQREKMHEAFVKFGSFTHPKVVEESEKLDVMIVYYQKLYGNKK